MVKLVINNIEIEADADETILSVALKNDIYIPNLCNHQDLKPVGACRLCLVELNGKVIVASCVTKVTEGMLVKTDTPEIDKARRVNLEMIMADHRGDCLECGADGKCSLQKAASYIGVDSDHYKRFIKRTKKQPVDDSNPFFNIDQNKCIKCGMCVRTCAELQGLCVIDFKGRGNKKLITTFANTPLLESVCHSCAECAVHCPTGAMPLKTFKKPSNEVKTVCPYCGCGCVMYLGVRGNKIVSCRGDKEAKANHGSLCVKGRFGYDFVNSPERLTTPLERVGDKFVPITWEEAFTKIAKEFSQYKGKFACLASAKCTNEENYVMQKFARVVMQTNNIDHCARLCHAPSVSGLVQTLGSGAMTNPRDDIAEAKCIFAIGTNTTHTHPIIALQIKKAVRNGGHLIVANPKKIPLSHSAEVFLQHRPGTDVALMMGMMRVIVDENLHDKDFISARVENFDEFREALNNFPLDFVEKTTGVPSEDIIRAARIFAINKPASILYAMGITQHITGTDNVIATSNLAVLTGNIGKVGSGVNPLRGQNNVQGSCDMGALPNVFTGYQPVSDPQANEKFSKAWGVNVSNKPGLTHLEFLHAVDRGEIEAMYIMGENPVVSEADAHHVEKSLSKLKFLVKQDIFLNETAKLANIVLPAASFAEKDGTFTNTERRVQLLHKAIDNIGESKYDWVIISEIAKKMGAKGFEFASAAAIMDEIAELTPSYGGISHARLEKEQLQWPCPTKDHPGTPILHTEKFNTPSGKAKLIPLAFRAAQELPDAEYPFLLTTDRSLFHYHTATMSRKVAGLRVLRNKEWLEIHPDDAKSLKLKTDQMVIVTSRRGEITVPVKVTDKVPKGVVSLTFHFSETRTNFLTIAALDPVAKIPETKVCAVRIRKAITND